VAELERQKQEEQKKTEAANHRLQQATQEKEQMKRQLEFYKQKAKA